MDDTAKAIIDSVTKRFDTPQKIPGGYTVSVFYDCRELTPSDLARLAAEATGHLDDSEFDVAVGIAYSGVFFAAAVAGGCQVAILQKDDVLSGPSLKGKKVVIVDDVVHSGSHLRRAEQLVNAAGGKVVGFACIVDRTEQSIDLGGKPLWSAVQTALL